MKEVEELTDEQIQSRIKMLENNIRILRNEDSQVTHEMAQITVSINDHKDKVKNQRVLPYLVANVVELVEVDRDRDPDDAAAGRPPKKMKCVIIKTTTRQVLQR